MDERLEDWEIVGVIIPLIYLLSWYISNRLLLRGDNNMIEFLLDLD
jgi:hypothetical protein